MLYHGTLVSCNPVQFFGLTTANKVAPTLFYSHMYLANVSVNYINIPIVLMHIIIYISMIILGLIQNYLCINLAKCFKYFKPLNLGYLFIRDNHYFPNGVHLERIPLYT